MRWLWPTLVALWPAVACAQQHDGRAAHAGARALEDNEDEIAFLVVYQGRSSPPELHERQRQKLMSNSNAQDWQSLHKERATVNASMPPVIMDAQLNLHRSTCQQLVVPTVVLVAGGLVSLSGNRARTLGQLLLFFGAQTFMNLYMKVVLSNSVVSEFPRMTGFQAPILLTAVQQLVSFLILVSMLGVLRICGFSYKPRIMQTKEDWLMILVLAVCFSMNIALNNFSLSLIDMSANVMIRSTSPMTALFLQLLFRSWFREALEQVTFPKLCFLVGGVVCAVVVVLSKKNHGGNEEFGEFYLAGVFICISSILSSSMELVLVVMIGKTIKLNPIETILYMSLPVVAILVVPSLCLQHGVAYVDHPPSTDWKVFLEVWRLSPSTMALVFLSGLFALGYNVLLYAVVADLSPFYTSFAANFNKVGAIALALLFGFEQLPDKPWNYVMVCAVIGNMVFFTAYSVWRSPPPAEKTP